MTSTLAPLQNPISRRRRRISGSPPTATHPRQPIPSVFKLHVDGSPQWLHEAKPHAFCMVLKYTVLRLSFNAPNYTPEAHQVANICRYAVSIARVNLKASHSGDPV